MLAWDRTHGRRKSLHRARRILMRVPPRGDCCSEAPYATLGFVTCGGCTPSDTSDVHLAFHDVTEKLVREVIFVQKGCLCWENGSSVLVRWSSDGFTPA
jgi:hypothetical protein